MFAMLARWAMRVLIDEQSLTMLAPLSRPDGRCMVAPAAGKLDTRNQLRSTRPR